MNIQHAHIHALHIHLPPAAELLSTFGAQEGEMASVVRIAPPRILQPWPGVDGIYVGVARAEDDLPEAHLVLLNETFGGRKAPWREAVEMAADLDDGAMLMSRSEGALVYANAREVVDSTRWHWLRTQAGPRAAWYQDFYDGTQYGNYDLSAGGVVRAVRRFAL